MLEHLLVPPYIEIVIAVIILIVGLVCGSLFVWLKQKGLVSTLAVLQHEYARVLDVQQGNEQEIQSLNEVNNTLKLVRAEQDVTLQMLSREKEALREQLVRSIERAEVLNEALSRNKQNLSARSEQLSAAENTLCAQIERNEEIKTELVSAQSNLDTLRERHSENESKLKGLSVSLSETQKNLDRALKELFELKTEHQVILAQYHQQGSDFEKLKTSLTEREQSHLEKVAQLEESKLSLTKEFENLANKIFEEKGKTFTHTSKNSIDVMLKPFREQIEGFQKRINEVHDASLQGNTSLNSEIKKVLEVGLKMSAEATNLTSALKGDSQKRGAWGEMQLQRTLEMSGLVENTHFEKQSAFKDAEGKRKQTDYIINLPGDKHIIIDSKVSLVAYDRAIAAKNDLEYTQAMEAHAKAVKVHIDDLVSKDYTNLIGIRSPNFILMFMPIEPAYIEALKNSKDLFSYGYDKGIVLVSHTTLIPILRTVANLWAMEQSNREAREIGDRAGEIYNNVCTLSERLLKLGNTMNTASKQYNDTVTALVGQQGLHGKVERFTQLSSKVSKSLPALEPKHIDFETEKLNLVAEPILEEGESPAFDLTLEEGLEVNSPEIELLDSESEQ